MPFAKKFTQLRNRNNAGLQKSFNQSKTQEMTPIRAKQFQTFGSADDTAVNINNAKRPPLPAEMVHSKAVNLNFGITLHTNFARVVSVISNRNLLNLLSLYSRTVRKENGKFFWRKKMPTRQKTRSSGCKARGVASDMLLTMLLLGPEKYEG